MSTKLTCPDNLPAWRRDLIVRAARISCRAVRLERRRKRVPPLSLMGQRGKAA